MTFVTPGVGEGFGVNQISHQEKNSKGPVKIEKIHSAASSGIAAVHGFIIIFHLFFTFTFTTTARAGSRGYYNKVVKVKM